MATTGNGESDVEGRSKFINVVSEPQRGGQDHPAAAGGGPADADHRRIEVFGRRPAADAAQLSRIGYVA